MKSQNYNTLLVFARRVENMVSSKCSKNGDKVFKDFADDMMAFIDKENLIKKMKTFVMKKIGEASAISESLSRGSLLRRRYRKIY